MALNEIPKWTKAAQDAVAESNEIFGYDLREVLDDSDWIVAVVDGKAEVMINKSGVRKTAILASDQDRAAALLNHLDKNL